MEKRTVGWPLEHNVEFVHVVVHQFHLPVTHHPARRRPQNISSHRKEAVTGDSGYSWTTRSGRGEPESYSFITSISLRFEGEPAALAMSSTSSATGNETKTKRLKRPCSGRRGNHNVSARLVAMPRNCSDKRGFRFLFGTKDQPITQSECRLARMSQRWQMRTRERKRIDRLGFSRVGFSAFTVRRSVPRSQVLTGPFVHGCWLFHLAPSRLRCSRMPLESLSICSSRSSTASLRCLSANVRPL
jgi:hypothetical protein